MQRALGILIVLLLVGGAVGAVVERDGRGGGQAPAAGSRTGRTAPDLTVVVLRPDQTRITGTLEGMTSDGAAVPTVSVPFTVTAGNRGGTRAVISNAIRDGKRVTITWDGGQPLPFSGTGGLDVAGAHLDVRPDGLTWALDGDARPLLPGHYRLSATVAIGSSGLATPVDGTTFDADATTQLATVKGGLLHLPPSSIRIEGPATLDLSGHFRMETATGARDVTHLHFGPGPFVCELVPAAGGWQINAILQGPVTDVR